MQQLVSIEFGYLIYFLCCSLVTVFESKPEGKVKLGLLVGGWILGILNKEIIFNIAHKVTIT
jgi:hypothetical protein